MKLGEIGHLSHGNTNPRTFFQPQYRNLEFVLQLAECYAPPPDHVLVGKNKSFGIMYFQFGSGLCCTSVAHLMFLCSTSFVPLLFLSCAPVLPL